MSVGMANDQSSYILSVMSTWPVTVPGSFCINTVCDYSLLHDGSSWGTHYYPINPHFPNQTAVSQMAITSSEHERVDFFLSAEMRFKGNIQYTQGKCP